MVLSASLSVPLGRGSHLLPEGTQRSEQLTLHSETLTHAFLLFFSYGAALLQKHHGSPWGQQEVPRTSPGGKRPAELVEGVWFKDKIAGKDRE